MIEYLLKFVGEIVLSTVYGIFQLVLVFISPFIYFLGVPVNWIPLLKFVLFLILLAAPIIIVGTLSYWLWKKGDQIKSFLVLIWLSLWQWLSGLVSILSVKPIPKGEATKYWEYGEALYPSVSTVGFPIPIETPYSVAGHGFPPTESFLDILINSGFWLIIALIVTIALSQFFRFFSRGKRIRLSWYGALILLTAWSYILTIGHFTLLFGD